MEKTKENSKLDVISNVDVEETATVVPGVPDVPSDFVNQCLDANEKGDGMLYAYLHQRQFVYVPQAHEWYVWSKHHWKLDEKRLAAGAVENVALVYLHEVHNLGKKIKEAEKADEPDRAKKFRNRRKLFIRRIDRLRSERGVRACLNFATLGNQALVVSADQLDNDPWILACANGVIDLKNGKLRPGRRDDWVTKASGVEYHGIDAVSEVWERFVLEICNNRQDVVEYLRKWMGHAITGKNNIHDFLALFGIFGRNGKSLLIESSAGVLGPLATAIPAEMLLEQPTSRGANAASPDIMALKGVRLVYASETDEGREFSSARVKWLTGGDSLTGRWPHDKYPVTFEPTHSLILLTNHKPRASASDYAFWERCRLICFEVSFVDRDPDPERNECRADVDLPEKLKEAYPYILAWMIHGCLEWQRDGHLKPPPYVLEATAEYRREEDILREWLDERCRRNPDGKLRASAAYEDFKEWYLQTIGKKEPSPKFFGKNFMRFAQRGKDVHGRFYTGWSLN